MKYEDKYLNRIASQHKIRPKYMAWLSALLDKIQDLHDLTEQLDAAFDLDEAVGVQLDMIGQSIGVSRLLNFEPVYASARLNDHYYRMILRARISLNQWDGTTAGIHQLWGGIFHGYTLEVVDNQDMTMTMRVYGLQSMFESEYISRGYAAPKPEGVGVNYEFILTFTLDSSIYIGGKVANERTNFALKSKPALEDMDANTKLHIGGSVGNVRDIFSLARKAPPEDQTNSGEMFTGGVISNTLTRFVLGSIPYFEDRVLQGDVVHAGAVGNIHSRFVLSSRDSPGVHEISGNLSAGGKMMAFHTSFDLPCETK